MSQSAWARSRSPDISSAGAGDDAAGSAALSRDVSELSRQIAERIALLSRERTARTGYTGAQQRSIDRPAANAVNATTSLR
jgi:hypothetical protein